MAVPGLVQHVCCQSNLGNNTKTYKIYFNHPVSTRNSVWALIQNTTGVDPSTVSDDTNFTKFGHKDDGNQRFSVWYRTDCSDAKRAITITYGSDTPWVQVAISEFSSIKSTSPTDGSNGGSSSGTGLFSNNVTTATDGDLILGWGGQTANTTTLTSWTFDGSPACTGLHADLTGTGNAAEFFVQSTHGAIELELTQNSSQSWCMFGCAFKNEAIGTSGGVGGARVIRATQMSLRVDMDTNFPPPNSWTFPFPCSAGTFLLIIWNGAALLQLNSVTDSNSNSWSEVLLGGSGGGISAVGPGRSQYFYAWNNVVCSSNMTITLTVGASGQWQDSNLIVLECTGLRTASDPVGATGTATGTQSSGTSFTGATINPTGSNGLIFAYIGAATGGDSSVLDNTGYGNFCGPIAKDSGGHVVNTAPVGENQGYVVYKNPDTTALTSTWATQNQIGVWGEFAVEFLGPLTGGGKLIDGGGLTQGGLIRGGRLAA